MAQYKTHTVFNLVIGLPLLCAGLVYFFDTDTNHILVFGFSFAISTLFMSPDMDVADKIKLFSIRGFFSIPFRLYAKVFKHRGFSHLFLIGTLTRLIWLGALFLGVFFAIYKTLPPPYPFTIFYQSHQTILLFTFLGVALADLCHLMVDRITTKK